MFIETRPFVQKFLKAVSEIFIVYVYTAGAKTYADSVLDIIDV
jgi:TFIIF-interacting CTD phosphatase-like protein